MAKVYHTYPMQTEENDTPACIVVVKYEENGRKEEYPPDVLQDLVAAMVAGLAGETKKGKKASEQC